jgi:CubicO group peptidase (beta-lactamase class C family)
MLFEAPRIQQLHRRLLACLTVTLVAVPSSSRAQSAAELATIGQLMADAEIPGLSIAFVADGEVAWDAALGVANRETGTPVTPETIFEAASLTKPVVAYAVLKLVERGQLDLDVPLWDLLPYPRLEHDERSRDITARHVLSHTTGLPNWGGNPLEMNRGPGERWGYSGEGFVYLQRVIEELTGEPLAELVRREVFQPLGMTSSSLVWKPDYDSLSATGHDLITQPVPKGKPEEANAAASLHTTAVDYALFLAAVLGGKGLEPATATAMLSPVIQVEAQGQPEHAAFLHWGLGWGLQNGKQDTSTAIWHWGDNGVFRCFVIAYPARNRGLVYFTNSENGLGIAEDLVSRFFPDTHHSVLWLDYWRWDDPRLETRVALRRAFLADVDTGMALLSELRAGSPEMITPAELGNLAQFVSGRGLHDQAVALAEDRVEQAPGPNAQIGLAEALTAAGRSGEAVEAYRTAVELDPEQGEALAARIAWLKTGIEAGRAPVTLTEDELARYVGNYGPRRIRLTAGRLVYSREGATEATPLTSLTRELFELESSNTFRIRFVLDRSGVPTKIVGTYSDGRTDETPRSRG